MPYRYLRRINHSNHSQLAVSWDCTVKPNWIRIVDGDSENVGICSTCSINQATEESCSIGQRCTWGIEGGLCDRMSRRREYKFNASSNGRHNSVWRVCDPVVRTNHYGLHTGIGSGCCCCRRRRCCGGTRGGTSTILREGQWK
jgi:hypothetical protein